MAVRDDKIQIFESAETDKRERVREAIDFKNYVAKFKCVENTQDMVIQEVQNENIIGLVGICDYDAVVLAHARGAVLVTGEMTVACLTKLDVTITDVAGIADFLCLIGIPVMRMFDVIRQMLECRFYAALTPTVITYISNAYDEADEDEKKKIMK
jgi:hypothetical protein